MDSILDDLDAIERIPNLPPERNASARELMERYARTSERTRELIERYGASCSANLVAALAFVLNRHADRVTDESCGLVYQLIGSLDLKQQPQVLQNCLAAIHRQLIVGRPWPSESAPPASLGAFIQHCLRYRGQDAWVVLHAAAELVEGLGLKGDLSDVFSHEGIRDVVEQLRHLYEEGEPFTRADAERALAAIRK